jgi:hypothetical protein
MKDKDQLWQEWLSWSRANPESDTEPACKCERKEKETRDMLSALTPRMIANATTAIFGANN